MKTTAELFSGYKIPEPRKDEKRERSFREHLINQFIDAILVERVGTQWEVKGEKELKRFKQGIAVKINGNPFLKQPWQLEGFLKKCKEAKSFGACFFGSLKTKNNVQATDTKR